ncbi:DsbA family oxidoreductase [Halococcus thailandensis]|uniref:DSBA oxidoreductase n=1 Tax=Halococcus thailandensis JCM 13552 TaxID=1227457 RepID=M0MVM1_9EURY|nr:DsbA family oxidoreductase [Halococcus thailandensis]EMA49646.1 DSBA oxidoreductase [Halococcus thailandensis JCM 13552]
MSHDAQTETESETLTMYADYVCPFCYLGEASLEQYRERRDEPLAVEWHPFDLQSDQRGPDGEIDTTADDGKDEDYYAQAKENVERLQEEYDVEMSLSIATDVDSKNAQQAALYVREAYPETFETFHEAVFDALWQDERDIGDPDVLADIATEMGIDADDLRAAIADDEREEALEEQFAEAKQTGVTGVPTFAYEGYAARGAVPPAQLERLVEG